MDLFFEIPKFISRLNIIVVLIFILSVMKVVKSTSSVKKHGGKIIDSFAHRSSMKIVLLVIIMLSNVYWYSLYLRYPANQLETIVNAILLNIFLVIELYSALRKIVFYENGLFENGKFSKWSGMQGVKESKGNLVHIELNKKKISVIAIDVSRVERSNEFLALLKKQIENNQK